MVTFSDQFPRVTSKRVNFPKKTAGSSPVDKQLFADLLLIFLLMAETPFWPRAQLGDLDAGVRRGGHQPAVRETPAQPNCLKWTNGGRAEKDLT